MDLQEVVKVGQTDMPCGMSYETGSQTGEEPLPKKGGQEKPATTPGHELQDQRGLQLFPKGIQVLVN